MNRRLRLAIKTFFTAGFGWLLTSPLAQAQVNTSIGDNLLLGNTSPIEIVILVINWALGILALAAAVIVIWGGFVWLSANGDEEKIVRAKAILRNGLIGLTIILAAWGIATYVINLLLDVTNAGNEYVTPPADAGEGDGSPFAIDHTNPTDGETDVPLCHVIAVTFSYPLDESTVTSDSFVVTLPEDDVTNPTGGKGDGELCTDNIECLSAACSDTGRCDGDQLDGSFDFSESGYAAVFYPTADYESNQTYEVELSTDIEGVDPDTGAVYNLTSGDPNRNFNFTTGSTTDVTPPTVDIVDVEPYPYDDDTEICLNPTLQVAFSESIDPASPSDSNFWLYEVTDTDADGIDDDPTDSLDIDYIRFNSLGGEADDTIATSPEDQLDTFTEYGINLYSGDSSTATFTGGIYDMCGNPLSGDFDATAEGSPTDDFVEATSAGLSQAFCTCTSGTDTCHVSIGSDSCTLSDATTCTLSSTCASTSDDYVGFEYQWTWTTGDEPYCLPEIDSIAQSDYYYSEDEADASGATGSTGSEDSGRVALTGNYLYPLIGLDFYNNISGLGNLCFNTSHVGSMSCFIDNNGTESITVRTPVGSRTGRITAENYDGSDTSAIAATISSPHIINTSPLEGPIGQYVTIRGSNFVDYDPTDPTSTRGQVFFDGIEAEVMCDDGWDDDQIIVRVPDGFSASDTPNIQVLAVGDHYSNQEGFTVIAGDPGPGICELDPECSDTGADDVTAVGENFGNSGTVWFTPSGESPIMGDVQSWDVFNSTYDSYTVVTDGTPVTEPDDYTFYASNDTYYSNGLDFDITCNIAPQVFEYFQCDLENTVYLPNPLGYWDNACVNSVVYFAFDQLMLDSTVTGTGGVTIYQCNPDDTFDDTTCTTAVAGSFTTDYLNNAYIGGDGSITMDSTTDIDGDGDTDVYDGYSAYTFEPTSPFEANYHYKVVVPGTVTNANSTPVEEEYSWHFRIRDSSVNCVADYLSLNPYTQTENSYDSTDACLDNYTVDDTSYSLRAIPLTSDCLVLDDAGNYEWGIDTTDIIGFGDNSDTGDVATAATSDTTTQGYNTVCLQGDEEDNAGTATVTADLLDPSDSTVAATDDALVTVDFGFCTQDSDCYTDDCRDTYCDPSTSHCAPDITSFSDDETTGQDVGPGGCVTLNGCYFGSDQTEGDSCTCTETLIDTLFVNPFDETEVCATTTSNDYTVYDSTGGNCVYTNPDDSTITCDIDLGDSSCTDSAVEDCTVAEGESTCLLDDRVTICSLGAQTCTLANTCSSDDAVADYSLGFFAGCTCSSGTDSCTVADGDTSCTITGDSACSSSSSTFTAGDSGAVTFNSSTVTYPDPALCSDTWDNNQVIVQVPEDGSLPAGDYAITLNSYYALSDTYGTAAGDSSDCTVGTSDSPCLCQVDPELGQEGTLVDLFGEHFELLTADSGKVVTFKSSTSRLEANAGTDIGSCSDDDYTAETTCEAAGETWSPVLTSDWIDDGSCSDTTYTTETSCEGAGATWTEGSEITTVTDAPVPDGSVSHEEGVRVQSDNYHSNALEFTVTCASNLDCGTGCCFEGQCSEAEACNACADDTDCIYGSCASACVSGTCAPYIIDVSPSVGAVGQPVTIQGCYFGTYYDPAVYTTGSQVTVDGITADLACNETDSWSNLQIIATIPDGIFTSDTDTTGEVQVQQVTTVSAAQTAQTSNAFTFTEDNSCSEVNLPVLCDATPSYSPYQALQVTDATDAYTDIDLEGENFYDEAGGYCTCQLDTMGSCDITEGSSSCTTSESTTLYVNSDNTSETCSDGSGTTASTNNAYTVYNSDPDGDSTTDDDTCIYTDLTDTSVTCNIAVGSSSCTYTESETCYADAADTTQTCTSAIATFTSLDGAVEYDNVVPANIDWDQYTTSQYITDVPDGSETGDVYATATTSDGVACVSNGLEFPVTCNSCSDCDNDSGSLNCNLDYDPSFGACTTDTTGFCLADGASCCGQTSCVYDITDSTDLGTCAPQPFLVLDDSDGDDMTDALEEQEGTDPNDSDTDADETLDGEDNGTTAGNSDLTALDSMTTPEPGATDVCPNAAIILEFDSPITTAEAFPYNDNDVDPDDPEADLTSDDIAIEDLEFTGYVALHDASFDNDDFTASDLSDISLSADQKKLTLDLDSILEFSTAYEIIISADDTVASGNNHQDGIVSAEYGTAVGCTSDLDALGLCDTTNDVMRIEFTTIAAANYQASCGPAYTILEADSEDFIDADYTFTESEQSEDFTATVYSAGVDTFADNGTTDADADGTDDGEDDQAIQRIDDDTEAGFWWTYDWTPVYSSFSELSDSSCPVAGIITEDDTGSCTCEIEESCTITEGDDTCTTTNGVTCETDSPSLVCDSLDSGYVSGTGCTCTVTDECSIEAAEASCSATINDTDVTCTTDSSSGVCDENDTNWASGAFSEDSETQTVTADTPEADGENTNTVTITITGDGSVEQGWGNTSSTTDDLEDSIVVEVEYCLSEDYLVSYTNSDYNFYWSYCRGDDPQADDFLPEFEPSFYRSDTTTPTIDDAYGSNMDFVYEVAFKDANALSNDPTTNNNTIAIRLYPNNLDGDTTTSSDGVSPALWYLLNTNDAESGYGEGTVDGYQAINVGATTYVAIMDYVDGTTDEYNPYIAVIAYSSDAESETTDVVDALLDGLRFNRNDSLSANCATEKEKVVRDTKRVNDLGTIAYLLSSYYYNDSDGNDINDFPDLATGSYISGLTTSVWPSWDATLGNLLGQSLPTDSDNTFANATESCPYDPPDVSAGETTGTYYDESGTCWDPVLNDFYGPASSYTYLYQYMGATDFNLYANLERIDGTDDNVYDPCSFDETGITAVDTAISNYSDRNCQTYDYSVDDNDTTDNATYADLF